MADGQQIVENVTRKMISEVDRKDLAPVEEKIPEGCVKRTLNMRDRNGIVGACEAYCQKDGHKKLLDQTRLNKIRKLLNWDETLEYFAMVSDSLEEERRIWARDKEQARLWKDLREGLITAEAILRQFPKMDLSAPMKKIPLRMPELSPQHSNGPESVFYIPSKLDAWVQDALKTMDWMVKMDDLAVDVCEKFGIKED